MLAHPTRLVEFVGWGRVCLGGATLLRPSLLSRRMGMEERAADQAAWLVRMFAGREAAIGWGAVRAVRAGEDARGWLVGQALADGADALGLLVAVRRGHVSRWRGSLVAAFAVGGVVADLRAYAARARLAA